MNCRKCGASDSNPLGNMDICKHTELEKMEFDRDAWKERALDLAVLGRYVHKDVVQNHEGVSVTGAQLATQLQQYLKRYDETLERIRHAQGGLTFRELSSSNAARQKLWDPNNLITFVYRGNELAGEVGELCNQLKKWERQKLGLRGSKPDFQKTREELGDGFICLSLIANMLGVDPGECIIEKFNKTSDEVGFPVKL